jgi:dihydrolipoamide dehydrogenase
MANHSFDLLVLGGGPGGYVAAIRAAQLGLNTAVIDENPQFGGTCLRVGCIPSKALLESSHLLVEAREHGISATKLTVDLGKMMDRKEKIVDTLTGGINMLLKKNKVTTFVARGTLEREGSTNVVRLSSGETIAAKHIIVATGSSPMQLPGVEMDDDLIGDSTSALSWPGVPKTLVVIGGGYIGLELGSVWNRLGANVIVLEGTDQPLAGMDREIGKLAVREFEKQGIQFRTNMWVESATRDGRKCIVKCKGEEPIECDRILSAAGRVPNSRNVGLETIGVQTDDRGFVQVNPQFETAVPGVYAIGDCIGGAMLAHKASEEGIACVEQIVTGHGHVNYDVIPAVVYTHPEIASVGKTEEQLKDAGIKYNKGACPYGANGRARAIGDTDGRIKILADAATDRILGVHAIGARAGDLISEAAVAMNFGASSEDLARCCHAHPTLSEIMLEAALAVNNRAIHTA